MRVLAHLTWDRAGFSQGVTFMITTPSAMDVLLPKLSSQESMRSVWLSGEALSPQLVSQVREQLPQPVDVFNSYGPTESAAELRENNVNYR